MGIIATGKFRYRGAPTELILELKSLFNIDCFIETGTFKGETAIWASNFFDKVITFEASSILFNEFSKKNCYSNIKNVFGDSSELLENHISDKCIYYLDAHYSGGNTFNSYPLLKELDSINNRGDKDFIFIDDARFVMSRWNNENYCNLSQIVNILNVKNRYTVIFDDLIISVPIEAKEIIDNYTNEKSKIYWRTFVSDQQPSGINKLRIALSLFLKKIGLR